MITLSDYKSGKVPLYRLKAGDVFYSDLLKSLSEVGLGEGDTVLVQSDILRFGKPYFEDVNIFFRSLVDLFIETISQSGTLIMPTFNYEFPNTKKFNLNDTESVTGALTNYFRNLKETLRTNDPMHSCSIWGMQQKEYVTVGNDTFGKNSIYEKLHSNDAKIMTFGTKFDDNCFFHYIEQKSNVPYRYIKTFRGEIIDGKNTYEKSHDYFVRDLEKNVISDVSNFVQAMKNNKILKVSKVGMSNISCSESKIFFDFGIKRLKENIYCFLKKPYPQYD